MRGSALSFAAGLSCDARSALLAESGACSDAVEARLVRARRIEEEESSSASADEAKSGVNTTTAHTTAAKPLTESMHAKRPVTPLPIAH